MFVNIMKLQSGYFYAALWLAIILTSCQGTKRPLSTDIAAELDTRGAFTNSLAYIGSDGNVYVTTADFTNTVAITQDAETAPEGPGVSYHRLSWSRDGWLAFAAVTRSGDAAQSKLYVTPSPDTPAQLVGESDDHFVIYTFWSPVPCSVGPGCRQLAYLIEEEDDIALRLVTLAADGIENRRIGTGWPFYYSWSPDGRSILWHTGLSPRTNPASELATYDVEKDRVRALAIAPGRFLAPAWSPTGDGWLGVTVSEQGGDELQYVIEDGSEVITVVGNGDTVFTWSPNGNQAAYMIRANEKDPFYGPIHIYDLQTRATRRVTDVGLRYLAHFWSPDGRKLAYLTWVPLRNDELMQWRVFDLDSNTDRGFALFNPTPFMRYAIASFNQYAQSHRFWSPDGRYLVFARRDTENQDSVWVVDTWEEGDGEPIRIDEGSIGYWTWE
jgi:TolB protein